MSEACSITPDQTPSKPATRHPAPDPEEEHNASKEAERCAARIFVSAAIRRASRVLSVDGNEVVPQVPEQDV